MTVPRVLISGASIAGPGLAFTGADCTPSEPGAERITAALFSTSKARPPSTLFTTRSSHPLRRNLSWA